MDLGISCAILSVTTLNVFLWKSIFKKGLLTNLVLSANVILAVNSIAVAVMLCSDWRYSFHSAFLPFVVLSGPFLFLIYGALTKKNPRQRAVLGHFAIPLVFIIAYLAAVSTGDKNVAYKLTRLGNIGAVIWLIVYLLSITAKIASNGMNRDKKIPFFICMLLLVSIQVIMLIAVEIGMANSLHSAGVYVPRHLLSINYLVILSVALLMFRYFLKELKSENLRFGKPVYARRGEYRKSPLTESDMHQLAKKIEKAAENGIYLKPGLSLSELASYVHAPAHHVTQTLNVHMQTDFWGFVNKYRVQDACRMLIETTNSIELIWQECGFNSKVSFNRQFRTIIGSTPLEFRSAHKR